MTTVRVALLPSDLIPTPEADDIVVVIDVLRATTTLTVAVEGGATVLPVVSLEAARVAAAEHPRALLVGERGGHRPEGFDAGNSPTELEALNVEGRRVILTTTNGTAACDRFAGAATLIAGGLCNAAAVASFVRSRSPRLLLLACSGRKGGVHHAFEDIYAAGAILRHLELRDDQAGDDAARLAAACYAAESPDGCISARYLRSIGAGEDVDRCLREDSSTCVPRLERGWFVPA